MIRCETEITHIALANIKNLEDIDQALRISKTLFAVLHTTLTKLLEFGSYSNFSHWQILDSSKRNELAEDNFSFHDNGGKFSKRVENTVWKENKSTACRWESLEVYKMSQFLHDDNNDDANAIALPCISSENSQAESCLLLEIFPFPTVFKRLVLQTCKYIGLFCLFWISFNIAVIKQQLAYLCLFHVPLEASF